PLVQVPAEHRKLWDRAFCITTHKSQGSQWPIVIYVADHQGGAKRLISRELVYTAISRAERCCLTIGSSDTIAQGLKRIAINERKTFLRELVNAYCRREPNGQTEISSVGRENVNT